MVGSFSNTIDELIAKSSKNQETTTSLYLNICLCFFRDTSKLANSFKSILTRSAQYSQLKTKFYGIVKGFFKKSRNLYPYPESEKIEKISKAEYSAKLAQNIGFTLMRRLKKHLRKLLHIQLNSLKKQEEPPLEKNKGFPQLKNLFQEVNVQENSQPQKIFDILVFFLTL